MELRGVIGNMGANTNLTTCFFGSPVFNEVFAGYVNGDTNSTPLNPIVSYEVSLYPESDFLVFLGIDLADSTDCTSASGDFNIIYFTTPAIGDPIDVTTHPLAAGLGDFNLPVDAMLAIFGMAVVASPLIIVTVFGDKKKPPGNNTMVPLFLIGISSAVALRFWPAVTIVFIGLFVGWALMNAVTGLRRGEGD